MRSLLPAIALLVATGIPCHLPGQELAAAPPPATLLPNISELRAALIGSWVGTLEYRDYSEPATSTKRVKLPTWLRVEPAGEDLNFRYRYDDGPSKIVTEISVIRIDSEKNRYSILDRNGKLEDSYTVAGFPELRQGHGILTLTGTGSENKAAVDVRTTIRIGRNILEITRETAVSGQPFTFRHSYTLVREVPS